MEPNPQETGFLCLLKHAPLCKKLAKNLTETL